MHDPLPGTDDEAHDRRAFDAGLRTRLYAEAAGERFPLGQFCHLWTIPEDGVSLPTGRVRVISEIEDHVDEWDVVLGPPSENPDEVKVPIVSMQRIAESEAA